MSFSITSINNANPNDTANVLILKSINNHYFCISKDAAIKSIVINDIIENLGDTDEPIPLFNNSCTSEYLQKVLFFLDYIHNNQSSTDELKEWVDSKGYTGNLPEWFAQYINVDQQTLFGIVLIADFLHIQILIDFGCLTIANQIKHMNPEEIHQVFSNN
jgi:hypothetical protein